MIERITTINRERLSVLVGLIVLSLSLLPLIESPSTTGVGTSFLGTPLRLEFSATTFVTVLAAALTCAGTDTLMRAHPRVRRGEVGRTFQYWIIPGLTVVVAAQLLSNVTEARTWIIGLALTGGLLWAVAAAEYATIDPDGPTAGRARLLLNALAYILAVLLFGLVWNTRARSLISATVTLLIAASLAFDLLWATRAAAGRVLLLALSVGLILAQSNWAINYWRTDVFTAAVSQLLVFYALVGLANQYLIERLNRRVLIEFAVVMALALFLLLRGR
ncbi:MAG: hypothetical protein KA765_05700 [Thermoflexales bacterium]|nr:hypothetical protein [Thermoflexales bacterium]